VRGVPDLIGWGRRGVFDDAKTSVERSLFTNEELKTESILARLAAITTENSIEKGSVMRNAMSNRLEKVTCALFRMFAGSCLMVSASVFAQGGLTPPGPPAPNMKSLQQIEPRTPISSVPFSIATPGSYYLTTNLTDTAGGTGITILVSDVTVDLNGFTLKGTNTSFAAVFLSSPKETNVAIFNGVLRDWPVAGIGGDQFAYSCRFENLLVAHCGIGVDAGWNCTVRSCIVSSCNGKGITAFDGSIIENCLSVSNSSFGILVGSGTCEILNSTARYNGSSGIYTGPHAIVKNCICDFNQSDGFTIGDLCLIDSCYSTSNATFGYSLGAQCRVVNSFAIGNSFVNMSLGPGSQAEGCVASLSGYGFNAFPGSTLLNCSAVSNVTEGIQLQVGSRAVNCQVRGPGSGGGSIGISLAGTNAVADSCQVTDNNTGIGASGGTLVIRNVARGNAFNYELPTNCMFGPIISFGSGANTLTGTITNSNPWANFAY
jgi:hypothetical protein